jgi:hypothetical protein
VGEAAFDRLIRDYMARFRFQSITTETFCAFVEEKFPGLLARVRAEDWLHQPGMPADAPRFASPRLQEIAGLAAAWKSGPASAAQILKLRPAELLLFLQQLPRELSVPDCARLDQELALTGRGNYEILVQWLCMAASAGHEPVFPRVREVLSSVGRMKYVRPLYQALGKTPAGRKLAREVFAAASPAYHGLTRRVAESVLAEQREEAVPGGR